MKQNNFWILFLVAGLTFSFCSCKKSDAELPIKYIFINKTNAPVSITSNYEISELKTIAAGDSIVSIKRIPYRSDKETLKYEDLNIVYTP